MIAAGTLPRHPMLSARATWPDALSSQGVFSGSGVTVFRVVDVSPYRSRQVYFLVSAVMFWDPPHAACPRSSVPLAWC